MSISTEAWSGDSEELATSKEEEYYHHWSGDIKRWTPRALPQDLDIDGKRVWEPPNFAYNDLIGEAYEKKREAMLKFMADDRAKATAILDVDMDIDLLAIYGQWILENMDAARDSKSSGRASFFLGLYERVELDADILSKVHRKLQHPGKPNERWDLENQQMW